MINLMKRTNYVTTKNMLKRLNRDKITTPISFSVSIYDVPEDANYGIVNYVLPRGSVVFRDNKLFIGFYTLNRQVKLNERLKDNPTGMVHPYNGSGWVLEEGNPLQITLSFISEDFVQLTYLDSGLLFNILLSRYDMDSPLSIRGMKSLGKDNENLVSNFIPLLKQGLLGVITTFNYSNAEININESLSLSSSYTLYSLDKNKFNIVSNNDSGNIKSLVTIMLNRIEYIDVVSNESQVSADELLQQLNETYEQETSTWTVSIVLKDKSIITLGINEVPYDLTGRI